MEACIGQKIAELPAPGDRSEVEPILKIESTGFDLDFPDDWHGLITALGHDEKRNRILAGDILESTAGRDRKAVIISERIGHLQELARIIGAAQGECQILTAETSPLVRARAAKRFSKGRLKILMSTFKSSPSIPAKGATDLFICSPVTHQDYLAQIVGSVLVGGDRNRRGRPIIHDYRDNLEVLRRSLDTRVKCYRSMGAVP
jgi:superfamily II DNA or RNA helicase